MIREHGGVVHVFVCTTVSKHLEQVPRSGSLEGAGGCKRGGTHYRFVACSRCSNGVSLYKGFPT